MSLAVWVESVAAWNHIVVFVDFYSGEDFDQMPFCPLCFDITKYASVFVSGGCEEGQVPCNGTTAVVTCISRSKVCDGFDNCGTNEDEQNCPDPQ